MASRMVAAPSSSVSLAAARMEQPVGEDVAALAVGGELDLVDGDEIGLERRAASPRRCRHSSAGEGGLIFSSPVISATLAAPMRADDLVVDLARQQPERQADDADVMRQHALDGEMGLAGIGRPEHGGDAATLGASWTLGEGSGHGRPPAGPSGPQPRGAGTGGEQISSESLTRPIRISFFEKITGLLFGGFRRARSPRRARKATRTEHRRIGRVLIFGICSPQHVGIRGLAVNLCLAGTRMRCPQILSDRGSRALPP